MRIWSHENTHGDPLWPQKIGVWAAITQRRITGSIFFQGEIKKISSSKIPRPRKLGDNFY